MPIDIEKGKQFLAGSSQKMHHTCPVSPTLSAMTSSYIGTYNGYSVATVMVNME